MLMFLCVFCFRAQLIVFDLEFGAPAASTPLPAAFPAFHSALGSFGHAAAGRAPHERGIDAVYMAHVDGSLSAWRRREGTLRYVLAGHLALAPPPLKFAAADGAGPAPLVLALGVWAGAGGAVGVPAAAGLLLGRASLGEAHPGRVRRAPSPVEGAAPPGTQPPSVVVLGLAGDGGVLQWQLPLMEGTAPAAGGAGPAPPPPAPPPPALATQLMGLLHLLPAPVTALCVCPRPVALPGGGRAVVAAAGTAAGSLELLALGGGRLAPFRLATSASVAAHTGAVRGVRWLGAAPRVVSFSSDRAPGGANAYANAVLLTGERPPLPSAPAAAAAAACMGRCAFAATPA
jgi:hypothetical protein